MNTPFSGAGGIGGTSGCFAIGGRALGGGNPGVLVRSRHTTTGQWTRTDAGDGYEYLVSDNTWCMNRDSTTN